MKASLVAIAILLYLSPAFGVPSGTDSLLLPGIETTEHIEFRLNHRFYGGLNDRPIENFLGTDYGANTLFGFSFALNPEIDFALGRSTIGKEYSLASKWQFNDTLAAMISAGFKTDPASPDDKSNLSGQLIINKTILTDLCNISLVPTITNYKNDQPTLALGSALALVLDADQEIIGEFIPVLAGYTLRYATTALGYKVKTWGHVFTLLIANTTAQFPDNYTIGSPDNNFHFGFNLIRKF